MYFSNERFKQLIENCGSDESALDIIEKCCARNNEKVEREEKIKSILENENKKQEILKKLSKVSE